MPLGFRIAGTFLLLGVVFLTIEMNCLLLDKDDSKIQKFFAWSFTGAVLGALLTAIVMIWLDCS